jgi:hypothetical protein
MTPDALKALLGDTPLLNALDVKTLVLEQLRQYPPEWFLPFFEELLPDLSPETLADYLYIRRPES